MSIEINFTEEERAFASKLASDRLAAKKQMNAQYEIFDQHHSQFRANFLGILAELALCKLLKRGELDKQHYFHGDGGVDLTIANWTIQVKYSYHKHGRLFVNWGEALNSEIYVLVTGDEEQMEIVGWIFKEDFEKMGYRKNLGYGDRLCVDQKNLRNPRQLLSLK